jgi:short-subunit dehydrogenase
MTQENPVVVITGATAGVGRATADEFARHGYKVALLARGREGLEQTRQELASSGATVLAIEADTGRADQIERAADQVESELGPIDVWVNSAVVTVFSPVENMTPEEFREVIETTFLGYVHGTLSALKRMKTRNRGTIVQVGSALAYRSIPLQSAYCAAKAAIRAFTDSLHSELIHDKSGVRLTMVQLPAHNTPQFDWARNKLGKRPQPIPPIYQPEVGGRAVYRAARKAPREYWVGRNTVMAIVGNSLAPGILDRFLARKAYAGQMTGQPAIEGRPDNLEQSVPGLHRQHGRFDNRSKSRAMAIKQETVASMALTATGAGVLAALAGLVRLARLGTRGARARRLIAPLGDSVQRTF